MKLQTTVLLSFLSLSPFAMAQESTEGTVAVSGGSMSLSTASVLAPAYEASCKIKAKEAAALAFRSCMTDGKNSLLEQARKEYQEQLSQVRISYEKELERMSKEKKEKEGDSSKLVPKSKAKSILVKAPAKASKPLAYTKKGLPVKAVKSVLTEMKTTGDSDISKSGSISEMALTLKPAPVVAATDEAIQDIPEPIAVTMPSPSTEANQLEDSAATIQLD